MDQPTKSTNLFEDAFEMIDQGVRAMKFAVDVEEQSAAGVMREITWVLWGDEALEWKLSTKELYAKFKDEVYNKGMHGLLRGNGES